MYCKFCYRMMEDGEIICPACGKPQNGRRKISLSTVVLLLLQAAIVAFGVICLHQRDVEPENKNAVIIEQTGDTYRIGSIDFFTDGEIEITQTGETEFCLELIPDESYLYIFATDISELPEEAHATFFERIEEEWAEKHPEVKNGSEIESIYFAGTNILSTAFLYDSDGQRLYGLLGRFIYDDYYYGLILVSHDPEEGTRKFITLLTNSAYYTTGQIWANGELLKDSEAETQASQAGPFSDESKGYFVSDGEKEALEMAKDYLRVSSFSRQGLIDQLKYEGFSDWDAAYGADHVNADWYEQAVKKAESYLNVSSFSYTGMIEQLEYEGFTEQEAIHGAQNCGADWMEQAVKKAKSYRNIHSYSKDELIDQLLYEGFTYEQAVYGERNSK